MIEPERIRELNREPSRDGRYVLYWMQASQRADYNHALEYAIEQANELNRPVVVGFGLTDDYPEANARHVAFMLEGLCETARDLEERGIRFVLRRGSPPDVALELAGDACSVVADKGYLRHQKAWRREVAESAPCRVVEVESDAVVPVETASIKEEYAAATLRPKLHKLREDFLVGMRPNDVRRDSLGLTLAGESVADPAALLERLDVDRSAPPVSARFRGGPSEAHRRLRNFIRSGLDDYPDARNDPALDATSHLSPYLHFGQISPLDVALRIDRADRKKRTSRDAFLEQLIVRRELSLNFVYFNKSYDSWRCVPDWAQATLKRHGEDDRPERYSAPQLERAETDDPYWNAAQREMVRSGYMHNMMRMYWGKKILEWTGSWKRAFAVALDLNNKYELDGRDPNSFAGVAWCFGKHDRPWPERKVFGKVRYMNANGLRRKFDIEGYVRRVESLEKQGDEDD